jgi:hypothetical protein
MRSEVQRGQPAVPNDDSAVDDRNGNVSRSAEDQRGDRIVQRAAWRRPSTAKATKSAANPGARHPMSSRPSARAPPSVAISSASRADSAAASPPSRASRSACRASASIWLPSFDALPSTPRPTVTPASRIRRMGAIPDPSRMFEHGQCATAVPVRANSAIPGASSLTQCACQTSAPVQPSASAYSAGVRLKRSRL